MVTKYRFKYVRSEIRCISCRVIWHSPCTRNSFKYDLCNWFVLHKQWAPPPLLREWGLNSSIETGCVIDLSYTSSGRLHICCGRRGLNSSIETTCVIDLSYTSSERPHLCCGSRGLNSTKERLGLISIPLCSALWWLSQAMFCFQRSILWTYGF